MSKYLKWHYSLFLCLIYQWDSIPIRCSVAALWHLLCTIPLHSEIYTRWRPVLKCSHPLESFYAGCSVRSAPSAPSVGLTMHPPLRGWSRSAILVLRRYHVWAKTWLSKRAKHKLIQHLTVWNNNPWIGRVKHSAVFVWSSMLKIR